MVKRYAEWLVDVVLAVIFYVGFTETTGFWHVFLGIVFAITAINIALGAFLLWAYAYYGIRPPDDR